MHAPIEVKGLDLKKIVTKLKFDRGPALGILYKMFRFLLTLVLLVFAIPAGGAPKTTEWWEHGLRLTGESEAVRRRALYRLKKIPELDKQLTEALKGERQAIALDVIVALHRVSFLPQLKQLAGKDPTGVALLALIHFIEPENVPKMVPWLRAFLQTGPQAPVSQILLDTLGRLGALLPVDEVLSRLKGSSYETADGVVNYARLMVLNHRKPEYLKLIAPLMDHPAYQIRLRTVFFIQELPPEWRQRVAHLLKSCQGDSHFEVRSKCRGQTT